MSPSDTPSTKAQRREAALAEAARLRTAQKRAAARSRYLALGALVAALLAITLIVVVVVKNSSKDTSAEVKPLADVTLPSSATTDGGLLVGADGAADADATAPVALTIYFDFMCPVCGTFEQINGADIDALREAGDITVDYRPVSILDSQSQGTGYSTRSANALAVVADKDPAHVAAFIDAMFASQPEEGSTGLSDADIASVAKDAGVSSTALDALTAEPTDPATRTFSEYVAAVTDMAGKKLANAQGKWGTPTILINGKTTDVNWTDSGALKAELEAAAK